MNFIETVTLPGQRQYILAAIHHVSRRVSVPGNTAHPTHAWMTRAVRNLLMTLRTLDNSLSSGSSSATATPSTRH
ncbi:MULTISPECIES: hypothetical protein [unclassified Streptomyces]|uniref:hypothetical protein n=1 Tax=unclassified Streptomyces TaxID=2593676 RepID=UPI002252F20E|nr:hypothetical protein [Streptomyces sp. NBC_00401]MCX5085368.1 hypothetical protein [Streptomyces sp. NBC_00401]